MRKRLLFVVVLVIAIAVSGVSIFIAVSDYTFHDPNALDFKAALNSTSVLQNQTVRVTLEEWNSLYFRNAPVASSGLEDLNVSSGPCGDTLPTGIAIYQGAYSLANRSSVSPLSIYGTGFISCGVVSQNQEWFSFQPHQNLTASVELVGYWTAGSTPTTGGGFMDGILHRFQPGTYTVVAGDTWGRAQVLYFHVRAMPGNPERSGPVSTFPACWLNPCSSCLNANATTSMDLNLNATSTLDHINVNQVYRLILNSSSFIYLTTGQGWVVSQWSEVGPSGDSSGGHVIISFIILTNGDGPSGDVFAYYDPISGTVAMSQVVSASGNCSP